MYEAQFPLVFDQVIKAIILKITCALFNKYIFEIYDIKYNILKFYDQMKSINLIYSVGALYVVSHFLKYPLVIQLK